MEKRRIEGEKEIGNVLPLMAAAVLGGTGDDSLKELIGELVKDQLEKRRKERLRAERLAESAVQAAKEEKAVREAQQRRCTHRKQDNSTRLAGQYLSGTGQLSLVCLFCGKNYFLPAHDGQEAPPKELIPPGDEIGG